MRAQKYLRMLFALIKQCIGPKHFRIYLKIVGELKNSQFSGNSIDFPVAQHQHEWHTFFRAINIELIK